MKTKVRFYVERDFDENDKETFVENHVFAYFPDQREGNNMNGCYAHVGQHSLCSRYYAIQCKEATPDQYAELKRELEGIGYQLEILNKTPVC